MYFERYILGIDIKRKLAMPGAHQYTYGLWVTQPIRILLAVGQCPTQEDLHNCLHQAVVQKTGRPPRVVYQYNSRKEAAEYRRYLLEQEADSSVLLRLTR